MTESFLKCISDFRQLRTLDITTTIYETSETHKPSDILALALQILPYIQPGPQLRELRLQLNPMIDLHRSQKLERTYGITRLGFLDILRGAEMQKRFPSLELFFLWLWEHRDADCAQQWWTEQILNRLPALQNVLQVQLMETLGQGTPSSHLTALVQLHSHHTWIVCRGCTVPMGSRWTRTNPGVLETRLVHGNIYEKPRRKTMFYRQRFRSICPRSLITKALINLYDVRIRPDWSLVSAGYCPLWHLPSVCIDGWSTLVML